MPGRVNLVSGRTVLSAPDRALRPSGAGVAAPPPAACPFCPGNETALPRIIAERPGGANRVWTTRVVPNKFPIVRPQGATGPPGRHEVVIETPRHEAALETMSLPEVREIVLTWRDRHRALSRRWHSVLVFRNRGAKAGQSLSHPHSQIVALGSRTPAEAVRESVLRAHYRRTGRALIDDLATGADAALSHPVCDNGRFAAVVPEAAEAPFETWVAPLSGARDFGGIDEPAAEAFGDALRDALGRVTALPSATAYTLAIVTAPRGAGRAPHWRWFAAIRPRLTDPGGFEVATGLRVNPSRPHSCAAALRARRAPA